MPKYTYLFTAEDAEGRIFVFCADGAYSAKHDDFVFYAGDFFKIRKINHVSKDGDEYALVADMTDIRCADAIYTACWRKKEEDENP